MSLLPGCRVAGPRQWHCTNWFPLLINQVTQVLHNFVILHGVRMPVWCVVPIAIATDAN